ncbi:hypothetical protein OIU77_031347 [Salix suchowensis]|uniref:Uncharacterized protein n=1 Tax=Salix suchowensis TaxID=1278906 RepID=A0ABQ9BIQ9_9ROSI|nr:hypothetical protein OIU77_031347 [Salix suchowensis]
MKECYWLRNRLRVECVEESSVQSRAFENGDVSLVLTQDKLVVISRSVEQDVLSPTERSRNCNCNKSFSTIYSGPLFDYASNNEDERGLNRLLVHLDVVRRCPQLDPYSRTAASAGRKMKVSEMASR